MLDSAWISSECLLSQRPFRIRALCSPLVRTKRIRRSRRRHAVGPFGAAWTLLATAPTSVVEAGRVDGTVEADDRALGLGLARRNVVARVLRRRVAIPAVGWRDTAVVRRVRRQTADRDAAPGDRIAGKWTHAANLPVARIADGSRTATLTCDARDGRTANRTLVAGRAGRALIEPSDLLVTLITDRGPETASHAAAPRSAAEARPAAEAQCPTEAQPAAARCPTEARPGAEARRATERWTGSRRAGQRLESPATRPGAPRTPRDATAIVVSRRPPPVGPNHAAAGNQKEDGREAK
jgi:hypothetical protein